MASDYPVKARTNTQILEIAKEARKSFAKLDGGGRVDLFATLNQQQICTLSGVKQLTFDQFGGTETNVEGKTDFFRGHVKISVSLAVFSNLKFGDGRARNTAAHEIGHAIMHDGPTLFRSESIKLPKWIEPFRSAEHQAKSFAPAFLIDDAIALEIGNAVEISILFGTSLESAEIYLRDLRRPDEKRALARKFDQLTRQMSDASSPVSLPRYLADPCSNCGQLKLFPVGIKYMCEECNRVFDRFQDGDMSE